MNERNKKHTNLKGIFKLRNLTLLDMLIYGESWSIIIQIVILFVCNSIFIVYVLYANVCIHNQNIPIFM